MAIDSGSKLMKHFTLLLLSTLCLPMSLHAADDALPVPPAETVPSTPKHRLIVLSDIEADPDDTQSFVRLFLYANEIDIEGLVATTSVHQKSEIRPGSILEVIDAYGAAQPNLLQHDPNYPSPGDLAALVKSGPPLYGMKGVGKDRDSEGSDWLIRALERDDDRPLWISVWGGPNVLAQALYKIRETRPEQEAKRLIGKLRVYTISDQDDSAAWIRREFPDLFYIVSPGGYGDGTWTAISSQIAEFSDEIRNDWFAENIQQGHGPLGAIYPDTAYGFEGDTPAFLSLIPIGLSYPDKPDWGGWGGRYELYTPELEDLDPDGFTGGVPVGRETRPIWTNAVDEYTPWVQKEYGRVIKSSGKTFKDDRVNLWRWRQEFQNDFAARMDWTTKSVSEANHPPRVKLETSQELTVKSGQNFRLSAAGSTDPDGDSLTYHWFNYAEPGTLESLFELEADGVIREINVTAPKVDETQTGHIILKLTDRGSPPLSRYARVIVTVEAEDDSPE